MVTRRARLRAVPLETLAPAALLWRKRPRTGDTDADPALELLSCPDAVGGDTDPSMRSPASHHHRLSVSLLEELRRFGGVDAQEETAVAARSDGHVAVDQERKPAEHALLTKAVLCVKQLAQAPDEILIEGHATSVAHLPQARFRGVACAPKRGRAALPGQRAGEDDDVDRRRRSVAPLEGGAMALLLIVPALVVLGVVLLAPLMLPGAIVVAVALAIAELAWRHHLRRAAGSH